MAVALVWKFVVRVLGMLGFGQPAARADLESGDPAQAIDACKRIFDQMSRDAAPWFWINEGVNRLINAGLYREALEFPTAWSPSARNRGRELDPGNWALVEVNLAEANYNLGELNAAEDRLEKLEAHLQKPEAIFGSDPVPGIVRAGVGMQRAWLLGLRGQGEAALQVLERTEHRDIPPPFRAEVHYTWALAKLVSGRFDDATRDVERGLSDAHRASSLRNGIFLLANVAMARSRLEEACDLFERGSQHHYKGQGGDALLRWAGALEQLGRNAEALDAYRLCAERDPQSISAAEAARRLAESSER